MLTISDLKCLFKLLRQGEEGQTMAEYSVVLAVICVATVGVFTVLSGGVSNSINRVVGLLP